MNYESRFRTSYFEATDEEALKAWASKLDVAVVENRSPHDGLVSLMSDQEGIPSYRWTEDEHGVAEDEEVDFLAELSQFIGADWLVEVHEIGNEGQRYYSFSAYLVDNERVVDVMYLGEFSIEAKEHSEAVGKKLTPCQY